MNAVQFAIIGSGWRALGDDEVAVAAILDGMGESVRGGKPACSLAEAAQDQYLSLLIEEAVASGKSVQAMAQPWANLP